MLNFFTTSNGFRSTLPVVSNLTAMNVWDGVCMCCIYASLLEFVLVNYVGRKRSDWPLPIVYQNKDQDYKQITQVRFRYLFHVILRQIRRFLRVYVSRDITSLCTRVRNSVKRRQFKSIVSESIRYMLLLNEPFLSHKSYISIITKSVNLRY